MPRIVELRARPLDIELSESFGIATGAQHCAHNVLVSLTLDDGGTGLGEAAPFPAVNGETQGDVLEAIDRARSVLLGEETARWSELDGPLKRALPRTPSLRCALECAMLDATARHQGVSLWTLFGAKQAELESDITIVTGDAAHARRAAERARAQGFTRLKVKVGADGVHLDAARLRAIGEAAPDGQLLLDANAAMSSDEALALLRAAGPVRERIALFEQPTARDDLAGSRRVREQGGIRVAADESVRGVADVERVAAADAADVVNVKITKTGLVEALAVIDAARHHGLGLMIGGMVESRLTMTVSACIAGGFGDFEFVDLDTPLFMRDDRLRGGFEQRGPSIRLQHIERGHGVSIRD